MPQEFAEHEELGSPIYRVVYALPTSDVPGGGVFFDLLVYIYCSP